MEVIHIKLESFILKNCKLSPLTPDSVSENYVNWLNDENINRFLELRFIKHTNLSIRAYVERVIKSKDTLFYGIYSLNDIHIGNIKLGPINMNHKFADVGFLIGDKNFYNKGIASEALRKICDYAFSLGVLKITAGAYEDNLASIATLKKVGFIIEGYRPNYVCAHKKRIGIYIFGLDP
jgi:RimJ/RimL family protein N-acetyltransferase